MHKYKVQGYHFTIDCSNSHRGLFAGILSIVATLISTIVFFMLSDGEGTAEQRLNQKRMAEFEVNVVEIVLYVISGICVVTTMVKLREMNYEKKHKG